MHFRMGIEGDVKLLEVIMEAFRYIYFRAFYGQVLNVSKE